MMKNAFYFTSEALFVLKLFKFFSNFFVHVGKRLGKKAKFNINFMTSQPGNNYITNIVNISRSKCSQTMKFDQ